jgi:hypothetical protein
MTLREEDKPAIRELVRMTVKVMAEEGIVMTPPQCERIHAKRARPWTTILYAFLGAVGGSLGTLACAKAFGVLTLHP